MAKCNKKGTIIETKGTGYNSGIDFELINSHLKARINCILFAMMYNADITKVKKQKTIKRVGDNPINKYHSRPQPKQKHIF